MDAMDMAESTHDGDVLHTARIENAVTDQE
jgi:hypothetical protein